jgi:hypothetical protein
MTRSSAVVADQAGLKGRYMNISHKLIMLGLALSLLGSTSAFANGGSSYEKKTATGHVPATETSGATGYAPRPSADSDKDGWPADMLLG